MDDREYELKTAELALREREVSAREREVIAKEKESHVNWWKNPLIIGLVGAALALAGNIATNILSNKASAEAEHARAQSNLVLSVIKTNGNEDDACKNLNFFVKIGWLDDPNSAIHNVCGTKGEGGVPTLPAAVDSSGGYGQGGYGLGAYGLGDYGLGAYGTVSVRVEDADSHEPIENATVTQLTGSVIHSDNTDPKGNAFVKFVSPGDRLTVSKDGYETTTKSATDLLAGGQLPRIVTIDLHRAASRR